MKTILSILILFVVTSPAFAGSCQSYADLPDPIIALEYNQTGVHDYLVRGTAMHAKPGRAVIQNAFAYQAKSVDKTSGITEYRWRDGLTQNQGLLKIKRENAQVVLAIIWTNTADPHSIYELVCND